jgi:flagellar biosynthesis protein FlhF
MKIHTFTASTANEAVAQIREQLGPEAVVLNVRQTAGNGLSRFWQARRIEVLACVPEVEAEPELEPSVAPLASPAAESADALLALKAELAEIRQRLTTPVAAPVVAEPEAFIPAAHSNGAWNLATALEQTGLLPRFARQVADSVGEGETSPAQELANVQRYLRDLWETRSQTVTSNVHLFIGPPGSGKTTALCKWLAQAVLLEGRQARVFRLDGLTANTAESLSVFAEVLGVPVERFQPDSPPAQRSELIFVDLPGVDWRNEELLKELRIHIARWPGANVHLVLNAAYESTVLLAQARAFSSFPVTDLLITHLDEELRWGKLWNLWLGTNVTFSRLSAGQNIPGEFLAAEADQILRRQFPRKTA